MEADSSKSLDLDFTFFLEEQIIFSLWTSFSWNFTAMGPSWPDFLQTHAPRLKHFPVSCKYLAASERLMLTSGNPASSIRSNLRVHSSSKLLCSFVRFADALPGDKAASVGNRREHFMKRFMLWNGVVAVQDLGVPSNRKLVTNNYSTKVTEVHKVWQSDIVVLRCCVIGWLYEFLRPLES